MTEKGEKQVKNSPEFTKIRRIGNSKGIIICSWHLLRLGLELGDYVNVRVVKGKEGPYIVIDPMKE